MKVNCSKCGGRFEYNSKKREKCPHCKKTVVSVSNTPTSSEKVAWVKD